MQARHQACTPRGPHLTCAHARACQPPNRRRRGWLSWTRPRAPRSSCPSSTPRAASGPWWQVSTLLALPLPGDRGQGGAAGCDSQPALRADDWAAGPAYAACSTEHVPNASGGLPLALAGGGASVIYADTVGDLGYAHEVEGGGGGVMETARPVRRASCRQQPAARSSHLPSPSPAHSPALPPNTHPACSWETMPSTAAGPTRRRRTRTRARCWRPPPRTRVSALGGAAPGACLLGAQLRWGHACADAAALRCPPPSWRRHPRRLQTGAAAR